MKKIVIASNNTAKLREFAEMLQPLGLTAIPQREFNIPEAAEPHVTFIENALAKARHASRLTRLPALADDSGICAVALCGAPGVYSAHYANQTNVASRQKNDARNNEKLVTELSQHTDKRAYYVCVLVFITHADDPRPIIAESECWGEIISTPRGHGGFGYDPYFYMPKFGCTAAELAPDVKNRVSHRGLALALLVEKLSQQQAFPA